MRYALSCDRGVRMQYKDGVRARDWALSMEWVRGEHQNAEERRRQDCPGLGVGRGIDRVWRRWRGRWYPAEHADGTATDLATTPAPADFT
ncbi:hypothetical protein XaCFBP7622_18620, partial [Xanthomonas arboricola]